MGETTAPKPATAGLLGGPHTFTGMAAIPNPGDLTRAERVKYYGHRYDYLPEPKGKAGAASGGAPRFQLITRRKADGTLQISMRPIANPEDMTAAERRRVYGNRYAPRAVVAAAPRRTWRVTPAAKPVTAPAKPAVKPAVAAAKPAARPVIAAAPAPVIKPAAPAPAVAAAPPKPVAAPKPNPTQQLQAAVSADINRGASLSVPADLKAGKEADVVLSLPGDLLAMVQAQAAKLGLTKPARKVSAYANLQGQGYEITPPGQQTAPVAAGKPTTFTWKVKPTEGEKSPLKADYGLELNGSRPTTAFSVGSLEEAVAAPVEAAKDAARGFKWPSFKLPSFKMPSFKMPSLKALAFPWVPEPTLPVVGKVARESVVGGALALLALILVIAMARGASANRARAERRRKFRTMQDYGVNEPDHAPDAHHTSYVNPMVAAAAGGAAGYSFASGGHDDHGHGNDDHGHDGHGDSHGHDDHGHGPADDHGQGHDDHGPAQHVSHDPHGQDDHGQGHDDPGHGDGHGHDDHGHGHDDHGHAPAQPVSHDAHDHDEHGPGHAQDDHGHGQDDHGHGQDDHGQQGHDEHHKEPEHAH